MVRTGWTDSWLLGRYNAAFKSSFATRFGL